MIRCAGAGGLLLLAAGCLPGPEGATLVPCNPFVEQSVRAAAVQQSLQMPPGTKEAVDRVLAVSGRVIAANPQIGFRPVISTVGDPKEGIFHRGTHFLFITEGLVRRCATDGQLAAVLCLELGRMVAEREAINDPSNRAPEERAPAEVPVGTDFGGVFGPPDGTRRMELIKYVEPVRHPHAGPPPSPDALAREYLHKADFAPKELDDVAPLRKAAEENGTLDRVITAAR